MNKFNPNPAHTEIEVEDWKQAAYEDAMDAICSACASKADDECGVGNGGCNVSDKLDVFFDDIYRQAYNVATGEATNE